MTECKLDEMVNILNHILNKTLDNSCPVAKARSLDPNNPWWTPQLKDMRHKVTKTYDKYKNDRKNESIEKLYSCLLYTSPSPRDRQKSRMPSSA